MKQRLWTRISTLPAAAFVLAVAYLSEPAHAQATAAGQVATVSYRVEGTQVMLPSDAESQRQLRERDARRKVQKVFVMAAERDMADLRRQVANAKAQGAAVQDVARLEERLRKVQDERNRMVEVMQREAARG